MDYRQNGNKRGLDKFEENNTENLLVTRSRPLAETYGHDACAFVPQNQLHGLPSCVLYNAVGLLGF
jgi:hypothetical protein